MAKSKRERGTMLVLVSAGILVLLGASALSVDVGYVYVVRNQLQNCADAAALAGAAGLYDEPGNYSGDGKAVREAKEYASRNRYDGKVCDLQTNEIRFPEPDVILVNFTRPSRTFFGHVFGVRQVNIRVRSAASVAPADGGTDGWRPWAPPDQFAHGYDCVPPLDPSHGPFSTTPHEWPGHGEAVDTYMSPYNPAFDGADTSGFTTCGPGSPTGYMAPRDVRGERIQLKVDSQTQVSPGNFLPLALAGTGGSNYEDNIKFGANTPIYIGDWLTTETGNKVGPTNQGVNYLISSDPTARMMQTPSGEWYVKSSLYPPNESPRIVPIPLLNPSNAFPNGRGEVQVSNIGFFFIDANPGGGRVYGYFVNKKIRGGRATRRPNSSNDTDGAFGRMAGVVQPVDASKYP